MPWLQLRINVTPEQAPAVESAALAAGAQAVTLEDNADQPIFEPALGETPLWSDTRITALFEADISTDETWQKVQNHYGEELPHHHWHVLEDKDWEREWIKNYHPIQCGPHFWICPSWLSPPDPNAINLLLDPGLAFGTGTHPTTFMCLEWLAQQNVKNLELIDYGCGSGILGIAGLLMGANSAVGVDIDPQALLATQENAVRNGLAKEAFPVFMPQRAPKEPVDMVLANILAGPLVELAPALIALVKSGGKICLSGVLGTQRTSIISAYEHAIEFTEVREKDEWICLAGIKK
ncbi:50S ribosomal protein L11 methyltransferase [Saccharophagus degradans]|uniref:50S ribosomal protein L11 methyltransferase n=1 Tax=Saccharophagus degradans TaxID=86304 RepID=UPI001C08CE54|nr:50S ribosomal protein L11 methyltransferase [Saccharophagus degradans]MBU2984790.1 50S ribosomal protein L11 methyltransferase [Saccharophagus degradans]